MFAIRIDLLTGRYAATTYNDRDQAEWPPHPARLFSALVATWADGAPGTAHGDAELAALRWLEAQAPPVILASATANVGMRTAATVFVPVNDVGVIKPPDPGKLEAAERALADALEPAARARAAKQVAALRDKLRSDTAKETAAPGKLGKHDLASAEQSLLDRRVRQPRTFPCAIPEVPAFAFAWPGVDAPPDRFAALAAVARRLVRLGHSSSMVHARVSTEAMSELAAVTAAFAPDDEQGELMIRWVGAGQTERLIRAHERHQQVDPRVLPARFIRYRGGDRAAPAPVARSAFDDQWIIFARVRGPRLPITSAAGLARQLRRALMSAADPPVHEVLSGHRSDGTPSERDHAAVVPLPFVTGPHPDGSLLGVALVLPRDTDEAGRQHVARAVERLTRQLDPGDDARTLQLELGAEPLILTHVRWNDAGATLRARSWTHPATRWASATPVALDRNPGDLHDPDPVARAAAFEAARASIVDAIGRIGLPPPSEVDVVRSCVLPGTAKPRSYPRFPSEARKPQRVLVHVRIAFGQPVHGPLLIGAGRYQGLGLCLPVDGPKESL